MLEDLYIYEFYLKNSKLSLKIWIDRILGYIQTSSEFIKRYFKLNSVLQNNFQLLGWATGYQL